MTDAAKMDEKTDLQEDQMSLSDYMERSLIIALIWCVWVFNQCFNLIIMLNFLIAVISNVYEAVTSKKELLMYT